MQNRLNIISLFQNKKLKTEMENTWNIKATDIPKKAEKD